MVIRGIGKVCEWGDGSSSGCRGGDEEVNRRGSGMGEGREEKSKVGALG